MEYSKQHFSMFTLIQEAVKFKRIGLNRGYNSAIHKMSLEDGRTFAIKITGAFYFEKKTEILSSRSR